MCYEWYGKLVTGDDDSSLLDDFDDLLHGFLQGNNAVGIIHGILALVEHNGYVLDSLAEDDLYAWIEGYSTQRIRDFHANYRQVLPDTFYHAVATMLTTTYPNDVPVKKADAPATYVLITSEDDLLNFLAGRQS